MNQSSSYMESSEKWLCDSKLAENGRHKAGRRRNKAAAISMTALPAVIIL